MENKNVKDDINIEEDKEMEVDQQTLNKVEKQKKVAMFESIGCIVLAVISFALLITYSSSYKFNNAGYLAMLIIGLASLVASTILFVLVTIFTFKYRNLLRDIKTLGQCLVIIGSLLATYYSFNSMIEVKKVSEFNDSQSEVNNGVIYNYDQDSDTNKVYFLYEGSSMEIRNKTSLKSGNVGHFLIASGGLKTKKVTICSGYTHIDAASFTNVALVETIVIPHSVTTIASGVFNRLSTKLTLIYKGTLQEFMSIYTASTEYSKMNVRCSNGMTYTITR